MGACGASPSATTGISAGSASQAGAEPSVAPAGSTLEPAASESATSAGSPSAAAAILDGCALLTDAEIEEVTGLPVERKVPTPGIGCQWDLDEGSPDLTARMVLNIASPGGRARFDRYRADLIKPTPIPGLGDEAVDDSGLILAVQGDALVLLAYPPVNVEPDMGSALVEIVFERL